jgi:antitoxin component YwqK of YwqJK toxin-antitoxin module
MRRALSVLVVPVIALAAAGVAPGERIEGWYESGAKMYAYHHRDGVRDGVQRQWYESGQLLSEFNYQDGHERGQQRMWNPDGTIRSNYVIRNGKRYGLLGAMGCTGTGPSQEGM